MIVKERKITLNIEKRTSVRNRAKSFYFFIIYKKENSQKIKTKRRKYEIDMV